MPSSTATRWCWMFRSSSHPVLYASTATNITKAIIDAYNLKSGIPAPPAEPLPVV